jgi:hypothetical protein
MFTDIYLYDDQKYPDVVFMGIQSGSLPSKMAKRKRTKGQTTIYKPYT